MVLAATKCWVIASVDCVGVCVIIPVSQVIDQVDPQYLESKLAEVIPGMTRGYCHSESSVRKASVFCLVALHNVVGDKMRLHLNKLSSSQVSAPQT